MRNAPVLTTQLAATCSVAWQRRECRHRGDTRPLGEYSRGRGYLRTALWGRLIPHALPN
jgi:hypothetical protein